MPYDPDHNAVTPYYGPALHFRGRYIESKPPASNAISTWWSLRVMVGCDPRLFDVKHNPKLEISAPHRINKGWKRIDCTVDRQVGYVMWACDFAVEMRGTPADVNYSVEFANTVKRHRFHVPAFNEDPHMMYCSCNDVEKPSHRYDEAYLSWKHFNETHVEKPFGLVIAGGDQIYADKCMTGGFENDLKQLETFFLNEYLRRFADEPHMALALAQVPFIMQPDDHDYYNGAGSHGKRERGYQLPRRIAHKFRFIFQLGRSASEAFLEDRFAESSRVYRAGPNIAILSLDHRSHRDVHRKPDALMHNATWQAMRQKTQQILSCDPRYQVRHLCVLFAVPVMFLQNDVITKISEMLNHELRSDFRDSPLSYHNRKQTRMMLDDLATIARNYSVRMTYLSGDAHVWGYGCLKTHGKHAPTFEQDPRGAQQWISSPMCNEPAVELGLMRPIGSFLAQTKRHLGPIDMKLEKLHPQRNYLRLYTARRPDGDVTLHGFFTREDALGKYIPDCEHVEAPPLRLNAKFRSGSSSGSLPGTAAAPASTALG